MDHRCSKILKLAAEHPHPLDDRLLFIEEGHKYYFDGVPMSMSVTGLLDAVVADHFDPQAALASMKRSAKGPNPKYSDVVGGVRVLWPDDRILAAWEATNVLGTDLHAKNELYLNDEPVAFDAAGTNTLEFQYFLAWWAAKTADGWTAFRTEWVIADPSADLAGSIDFVMHHASSNIYAIVDFKRCMTKDAGFLRSFGKRFLPPLSHLEYNKNNKWALQVNAYRTMLEAGYGIRIGLMCMVVFHAENARAEEHVYPSSPDAEILIARRRKEVLARRAAVALPM